LGRIDPAALRAVTTEDRMVKFHVQEYERCAKVIFPVCSWLSRRQIDQTFGIMDVKGVGLSHLTGEVKRLLSVLTKYDQDNYPEMLGRIVIINAPVVFKAVWGLVKPYLNPRTISKIAICGSDYLPELLEYVDADNLPEWLGGRSKGTLLDDAGPWSDAATLRRIEQESSGAAAQGKLSAAALAQLRRALRLAGLPPAHESIPAAPLLPHVGGGSGGGKVVAVTTSGGGGGAAVAAAAGAAAVAAGAAVVRLSSSSSPDEQQQVQQPAHPHHHHHHHHTHPHPPPQPLSLGGGGHNHHGHASNFGGGPGSEATEGGYATPRSDLSLFSPSPSVSASSAGGGGGGHPPAGLDAALLRLQSAGGGDSATSALREANAAASPRATREHAAGAAAAAAATPSPSPAAAWGALGASASRTRGLLERLAVLERQYGGQVQRLKGYLPALPPSTAALLQEGNGGGAAVSGATGGSEGLGGGGGATTLQRRVESLEAAMDLLLRAQELEWQQQQQQQQGGQQRRRGGCLAALAADGAPAGGAGGASSSSSRGGCVIS
jgi:hypothetical protein